MTYKEWKILQLKDVIHYKKGYAFNSKLFCNKGTRVIRITDTTHNSIHDESPTFIPNDIAINLPHYILKQGDIILTTVGSRPHLPASMVGKTVTVSKSAEGSLLNQNMVILRPKVEVITREYLLAILKEKKFIEFISTLIRGNANQVSIALSDIFSYELQLPNINEQIKITQILSTWNKAIETTEQLLTNSQQQKKALMQQLLTGKKRFTEFINVWNELTIGNIASVIAGATPNTKKNEYWDGDIPWMNSGDIHQRKIYSVTGRITESGFKNSSTKKIPKNCVLIALAGQGKTRGTVAINKIELCTNQSVAAIIPKSNLVNYNFLFHNLHARYTELRAMSTGDGGRGGLNLSIIKSITIKLPSLEEQQKIASILSIVDNIVETLQQKLKHLEQEKKALMQQLLTGKRRVNAKEISRELYEPIPTP